MRITPQKRRFIIGGCLGALLFSAVVIVAGGWLILSPNSPINRASALDATKAWARLADFPTTASDLHVETTGNMFTRGFRVSFRDTPTNIRAWLAASPGPATVSPTIDPMGWKVYTYPAGGGAVFSEVHVVPSGDEVRVRTYWS